MRTKKRQRLKIAQYIHQNTDKNQYKLRIGKLYLKCNEIAYAKFRACPR